jgi:hypothetical protein
MQNKRGVVKMSTERELLTEAYRAFNARELEAALATMHPDVEWPNGMEGGYVYGHEGVRAYWTRQWQQIDPHVAPQRFERDEAGRTVLAVHQVVRDMMGSLLMDKMLQHVFTIENGLIRKMEIQGIGEGSVKVSFPEA